MNGKRLLERATRNPETIDDLNDEELALCLAEAGVDTDLLSRRVKELLGDSAK